MLLDLVEIYLRILVSSVVACEVVHPLEELMGLALLVDLQKPLYITSINRTAFGISRVTYIA